MTGTASLSPAVAATANDRLKGRFGDHFWSSLALAALLHFLLFAFWPQLRAEDLSRQASTLEQLQVVEEFEIPPPPEEIARPAVPVLSPDIDLTDEFTIAPTTFEENPVADLPPPPLGRTNVSGRPVFTPYEVEPVLRNREEFGRALERSYPSTLREAGIGGTVILWVRIDEEGAVRDSRVVTSSGQESLDALAQELMRSTAEFSPALNRDQKVAVWIQLPVTFRTR